MRAVVWADADQESLVREAIRVGDLEIVAIGSDAKQDAVALGKSLGADRVDDLRQAVHRDDTELLWIAASRSLDSDSRRLIGESGIPCISCEPQFGAIAEAVAEDEAAVGITFVPMMRRSPGYRAAAEIMADFGEPQCVNVFFRGGAGQGTLFARLFDAMSVIQGLCGPIETINAGLAGPLPGVPEGLAGLHGHMTINLRFKPNRCACIALSDTAGAWFRGVTVLGDRGCLRINDSGFEWIGPDGRMIDGPQDGRSMSPGELIGLHVKRVAEATDIPGPPPDNVQLLALCEAARLSCLTGQDEAPGKLIDMLSRP